MSSTTKAKRLRRVEKRSLPEVLDAVHAGKLSPRVADQLLYLSPTRQRVELAKRLRTAEEREQLTHRVAEVIRNYLDHHQTVDLHALREELQTVHFSPSCPGIERAWTKDLRGHWLSRRIN